MFCLYKDTKLLTNKQVINKKSVKLFCMDTIRPLPPQESNIKRQKLKIFTFLLSILEIFDLP